MYYKQEIRKFIVENFLYGDHNSALHDDTSFLESGIIDSTGVLELVSFLQDRYNVRIRDEELLPENLDSLNNISKFIAHKKGNGGGMDLQTAQ